MLRFIGFAALLASPAVAQDTRLDGEPPVAGSILMFRGGSVWGAAVACPIRYHGNELVELGRGKYAEWSVAPGRYILTNKTASVEVNVGPGEIRYVRCQVKSGFMSGRADLQIVDRESFDAVKDGMERKDVTVVN